MPSSHHRQLNEIMTVVKALDPMSVLDVGVGAGKFGVLCREYLELWDGRYEYKARNRKIDGIEIFEDYLTPLHDFVYDEIMIGDAIELMKKILPWYYDLILIIDLVEHFSMEDGRKLLICARENSKNMLIATPKNAVIEKRMKFGNIRESHLSRWTPESLMVQTEGFVVNNQYSHILFQGEDTLLLRGKLETELSLMPLKLVREDPDAKTKSGSGS